MAEVRKELRFVLNDEDVILDDFSATRTLLDYLRLDCKLTGSKEGCAEGDCGACTVLVGRERLGRFNYEAVTACITFLGQLDATHVVTVEHLSSGGKLGAVQQAMVAYHGSQCGFCTPGIVMSLEALWLNNAAPTASEIEKALQGNLCRCTGYSPIVRAGLAINDFGAIDDDPIYIGESDIQYRIGQLLGRGMPDGDGSVPRRVEVGQGRDRTIIPASVDDLAEVYGDNPTGTIVAGATDVGLWVTKFMRDIGPLIFIGGIEDLRRAHPGDDGWYIGGAVTYTELGDSLTADFPGLAELWPRIGGEQVRNMGTIGGNVANGSPIGDTPPPFIALGAKVTLRKGSERRTVALEDYFIAYGKQDRQPGEFVEEVFVPYLPEGEKFACYKVSKRRDEDISALCGAFRVLVDDSGKVTMVRVAFGGMAATPKRAKAVEAALLGKAWTSDTIEAALPAFAEDYQPLSDLRASAEYRLLAAQNLLRRFHLETTGTVERLAREVA